MANNQPPKFGTLNFKEVCTTEDLGTLKSVLEDMDLPEAIKRKRELKDVIDYCFTLEEKAEDRYSFRFLDEGIRAYIYGLNEAAIFYASISVEVLLLSQAFKKEKTVLDNRVTFASLISTCRKLDVLDNETSKIANDLRVLRDCYVHYDNRLNYDRLTALQSIEFVKNYNLGDVTEARRTETYEAMRNVFDVILCQFFQSLKSYHMTE